MQLKREDNSSVTRFACATFPTREGKAASPCRVKSEPARTLVWQSYGRLTEAGSTQRFPRQCAQCLGMTKGAQRLGLPTGGLSSKARLGSLCASRLHNVSVEWRGLTFYDFPFNGTELLLKREDNSSVTRFACATFPTREGKAASPRRVIANQRARSPSCHCEAVRTLPWQSPGRLDRQRITPRFLLTPSRLRRATPPHTGRDLQSLSQPSI